MRRMDRTGTSRSRQPSLHKTGKCSMLSCILGKCSSVTGAMVTDMAFEDTSCISQYLDGA
jgi:hypothetical protein